MSNENGFLESSAYGAKNIFRAIKGIELIKHPFKYSLTQIISAITSLLLINGEIYSLPKFSIDIVDDESGRVLRKYLRARPCLIRTQSAASVLHLPNKSEDYFKGRVRRGLRNNISRSNSLGLVSKPVLPSDFKRMLVNSIESGIAINYLDILLAEPCHSTMENWVGFDNMGIPIAYARLQIHNKIAWLKCVVAINNDERSIIRYKLSSDIFLSLVSRQIDTIIAGSAIDVTDGLAYFQYLLGFRPSRIEIRRLS
jgi:hypothetical protein